MSAHVQEDQQLSIKPVNALQEPSKMVSAPFHAARASPTSTETVNNVHLTVLNVVLQQKFAPHAEQDLS